MEHNRENGNRGGHPGGDAHRDGQRRSPAQGFEGMNYEQRREPYFAKRQSNGQNDPENASGSASKHIDDRSPV